MITTISTLPPEIVNHFNKKLLYYPCKFEDDPELLYNMYLYVKERLFKKTKNRNRLIKLEAEFLELYERSIKKEKDAKTKAGNITQMPFYRIKMPNESYRNIFDGLRNKEK